MMIRNALVATVCTMFVVNAGFAAEQPPAAQAPAPAAAQPAPAPAAAQPAPAPAAAQPAAPAAAKAAAPAQPAVAVGGKAGICKDDVKKFCSNIKPGGGKIYECLTSHSAELAPACRDGLAGAKARWDQFAQACRGDAEKYCKNIPVGQARVLSCLKGRESDLAPACKAEFQRARADMTVTQ